MTMKRYQIPATNKSNYHIGDPIVPIYVHVCDDPDVEFKIVAEPETEETE